MGWYWRRWLSRLLVWNGSLRIRNRMYFFIFLWARSLTYTYSHIHRFVQVNYSCNMWVSPLNLSVLPSVSFSVLLSGCWICIFVSFFVVSWFAQRHLVGWICSLWSHHQKYCQFRGEVCFIFFVSVWKQNEPLNQEKQNHVNSEISAIRTGQKGLNSQFKKCWLRLGEGGAVGGI